MEHTDHQEAGGDGGDGGGPGVLGGEVAQLPHLHLQAESLLGLPRYQSLLRLGVGLVKVLLLASRQGVDVVTDHQSPVNGISLNLIHCFLSIHYNLC